MDPGYAPLNQISARCALLVRAGFQLAHTITLPALIYPSSVMFTLSRSLPSNSSVLILSRIGSMFQNLSSGFNRAASMHTGARVRRTALHCRATSFGPGPGLPAG